MTNFVPRRTRRVSWWLGLLAVSTVGCLGGCDRSKESAQQVPGKKYEVADDDDKDVPQGGRTATEAGPEMPPSSAGVAGQDGMAKGDLPDNIDGLTPPPPALADQLEAITVPDGTPAELLAFIDELGGKIESVQAGLQGQPRSVAMARMQEILEALLMAADKILASSDADQAARRKAIDTKAGAMSVLSRLAPDGKWGQKVKEFGTVLATDKDPGIAVEGRAILFGIFLGELAQGRSRDYDGLMTQLKSLLTLEARSSVVYEICMQAVNILRNAGQDDKAREAFGLIAVAFKDHQDPELAREAARMAEQVLFMDSDMEVKFNSAVLNQEGAADAFCDAMDALLKRPDAGSLTVEKGSRYVSMLEQTAHYELARRLCGMMRDAFQASADETLQKAVTQITQLAQRRLDLIGKPLVIEATRLDGGSLDFASYQGKPVLVAFFGAFDPRCQQEMALLKSAYEKYHGQGFEVIGVSLDRDRDLLSQYLAEAKLPWVIVTNNKLAEDLGVEMIPFFLFLDREGKVTDIYLQGPALDKKLTEVFGSMEDPAIPAPQPTETPGDQSYQVPSRSAGSRLTSFVAIDAQVPHPEPVSVRAEPAFRSATDDETDGQPPRETAEPGDILTGAAAEDDELTGVLEDVNPYLARPGLADSELISYLFDMQEKSKSIRQRPGFAEAIVEAADRLLAGRAPEKFQLIAAEAKFSVLHEKACLGSDDADGRLQGFVDSMGSDSRPEIAARVEFFRLERRALQADQIPLEQIPALLADLLAYLQPQRKLEGRHLRLASATVHAVNRLQDDAEREKYFAQFGQLFAKSDDRQLAQYGKQLAGGGKGQASDLVGKPLELEGLTDLGTPLDWNSYRGKVVLVDFWATWCGPCLREMPHIRSLHGRLAAAGFEVVAVSVDEDLEALAKYLDENKVPWTNLVGDGARALATKYQVRGIPTLVLVDKTGQVAAVANKVEALESQISKLLETAGQ